MEISGIENKIVASELPLEHLVDNKSVSEADKAKEVARQFEAIMVRQILKSAQNTGVKGLFSDESASKDVYFDMMNYHMADAITRGGGVGMASAFEAQLRNQMSTSELDPTQDNENE